MADSIPSLRKKLDAANAEIARLQSGQSAPAEKTIYQERIIEVPTVMYVTDPDLISANKILKERVCQLESLLASESAVEK